MSLAKSACTISLVTYAETVDGAEGAVRLDTHTPSRHTHTHILTNKLNTVFLWACAEWPQAPVRTSHGRLYCKCQHVTYTRQLIALNGIRAGACYIVLYITQPFANRNSPCVHHCLLKLTTQLRVNKHPLAIRGGQDSLMIKRYNTLRIKTRTRYNQMPPLESARFPTRRLANGLRKREGT